MSSSRDRKELDLKMGKIDERKRMKYLLETGIDSDVEFLVHIDNQSEEKKLFKAHKFVLKNTSTIFASQFNLEESVDEVKNVRIEIKDTGILASAFNAMLHFVYTDDCYLISSKNIVGVYLAAKKYLLNSLVHECIEMVKPKYATPLSGNVPTAAGRGEPPLFNPNISNNEEQRFMRTMLDEENVFEMLKIAKSNDEVILLNYCWKFIDQKIGTFRNGFRFISREEIAELLERDTIKCQEIKLFNHLNNWAAKQCQKDGIIEPTGEDKHSKMGTLLNAIRFPLIPPMEFIKKILPTNILSKNEITAILLHYISKGNDNENMNANIPMPFSDKPRALPRKYNKLIAVPMLEDIP